MPMIGTIGSPALSTMIRTYAINNVALIKIIELHLSTTRDSSSLELPLLRPQLLSRITKGRTPSMFNLVMLRTRSPFQLPPHELQREFARRVAAVEKLKAAHRASLAEMDALFASLQHRAFRGEL